MKMVGLCGGGGVTTALVLILVSRTCATTSSKPEFTDLTNGTSSFEPSSASTPLTAPSPTTNGRLSTHSETTASVILTVVHNTPTERTATVAAAVAVASTPTPTEATIAVTASTRAGSGEAGVEEYYSSYDYPETNNHTGYTHKEPGVIPDPSSQDSFSSNEVTLVEEAGDVGVVVGEVGDVGEEEEEVSLPDDSLADTDLHDHDLIDSVMYIYFGSSRQASGTAGRQVLIVGAAVSLMAQFLALASVVRRLRVRRRETSTLIFLSTEFAMTTSNLIFMLGVQATDKHRTCETVALLLHYLYLVSSCWLFSISCHVYQRLRTAQDVRLRWCWPLAWLLPAALVMACYLVNSRGYETHLYCWMSVERGMVLSFMVPMSTLILLNAAITVLCQRLLSRNDINKQCDLDGSDVILRSSLLAAAMLLPLFAVAWFLRVVALENGESVAVPVLAALTDAFLNWYIFLRSHVLLPYREPPPDDCAELHLENDVQPLLSPEMSPIHVVSHGTHRVVPGELLELRLDAISTIST